MTLRSHCKLQNGHPWKSVKLKENVGILKYFHNSHWFHQEKVDFPASKSISECCLYLSNFSKSVKQSLEILVHTHKMIWGRLDHIVETIRKLPQKSHIGHLFVHFSKELCPLLNRFRCSQIQQGFMLQNSVRNYAHFWIGLDAHKFSKELCYKIQ